MFFLFGTRRAFLKSHVVNRKVCPNCKEHNCISYNIYRSHFHIFWIPIFPLFKSFNAKCNRCYAEFVPSDVPDNLLEKTKGKKWQFTGTLIILALILAIKLIPYTSNKMEFLAAPLPNDTYTYKVDQTYISLMKVDYTTNDSVYLFKNHLSVPKTSFKIFKINKDENYAHSSVGFSIKEIIQMGKDDIITSVKRK